MAQSGEWIKKPVGMRQSHSDLPQGKTDQLISREKRRTNSLTKFTIQEHIQNLIFLYELKPTLARVDIVWSLWRPFTLNFPLIDRFLNF